MRALLASSLCLNAVALAAFAFYVYRRGGPRYLIERAGFVRVQSSPTEAQIAMAKQQAQLKVRPEEIIFAGDSLIMRAPVCEAFGRIKNFGIAGDISDGLLERVKGIAERRPKKLFLQIGTNDLLRGVPIPEIVDNVRMSIQAVRSVSPETRLYLMSILPVHKWWRQDLDHERKIIVIPQLNEALSELAKQAGAEFIEMYEPFVDERKELRRKLSFDGVHLNPKGYQIYLERLAPYVE